MSSSAINVGVVGMGPRSQSWLGQLRDNPLSRVVAFCDRRSPLLETRAAQFAEIEAARYTDFEKFLAHSGLDAVVVLTNPMTQTDLAVQAMESGKHVTTEVPACNTIEDCWRLVLAQERSGVVYQLGEQVRYWGFVQAWRKMVAEGQLGKVFLMEGEYIHFLPGYFYQEEATGKYVPELAAGQPGIVKSWRHHMHPIFYLPHTLSPLLSIIDDRVTEVTAMGTRPRSYYLENVEQSDLEVALMKTAKDTLMRVAAGFTAPAGPRGETSCHWYHVRGSQGAVEWKRAGWDKPKLWLADGQMPDWSAMSWSPEIVGASHEARASGHGGADYYAVNSWLEAIRDNATPPLDVYKSVETAAPAAAAILSIERGSAPIKVPDFRPNENRTSGEEPETRLFM